MENPNFEAAQKFLNDHHKAIFTVLDQTGAPNSSLMHYVIDDEFNFFIGTKKGFGKYHAMCNDPRVAFAIPEGSDDPLKVIDMQGTASEIPPEDTEKYYEFFKSKNDKKHYVQGAEDFVMFKITPNNLRYMDASSGELQMVDIIGKQ